MAQSKEASSIFSDLWRRILTDPATPRWTVGVAAYLLILAVTANHLARPQIAALEPGKVAGKDYVAPYSAIYIDSVGTEQAKDLAANEVSPVFSIDTKVIEGMTLDLGNFFLTLDDDADRIAGSQPQAGGGTGPATREGLITAAVSGLRRFLDQSLKIQRFYVEPLTDGDLRELLSMDGPSRDKLQDVVDRSIRERIIDLIYETDLPQVLDSLPESVAGKAEQSGLTQEQGRLAAIVASYFLRPNAIQDSEATELARQQARDATAPVQKEVRKDQIFLRKGEIISQEDMDILQALGMAGRRGAEYAWLAILLFAAILATGFVFGMLYLPAGPRPVHLDDFRYYLLLFSIVTLTYLSSFFVVERLSYLSQGQPATMLMILSSLPVVSGAVLLGHYFSRVVAATISGFLGILITLAAGDPGVLLPALLPSLSASLLIKRDAPRSQLFRAIIFLPFIWAAAVLAETFTAGLDLSIVQHNPWILVYGIAPAPVAFIFANFVLDGAFNIPTANRLREFDTPDHPLLKKLQLEAAGTWHHSMMVGLIAEAACQALGGNTLLVRVSCMYHDVGKLRRPEFFVENQFSGVNIHDKYSPWLSKIIIESHVKDGLAMGKAHGLPQEMLDMIPEHHGTSLITYFFRKALAISEEGYVNEYDYRYPGPKPQTLEAACINLADACESATRTLEEPTPHRIESLVNRIYEERLLDGQYDECGLALNQLDTIKTIIIERLTGAYHARIEYPEEEELRRQFQLKRAETGEKPSRKESPNGEE